jgi:mono/diheme cytochrome c family protein
VKRFFVLLFCVALVGVYYSTTPSMQGDSITLDPDPKNGEYVYFAAGCGGCHTSPDAAEDSKKILSGGQKFPSPFGTFVAPNVSMHVEFGIGAWSQDDFVRAVRQGVSPDGRHYYPAFPYTSYQGMSDQDVVDLWSFWQTLPSSEQKSQAHHLPIYAKWRRPLGIWKMMFQSAPDPQMQDAELARGEYLVNTLGHCGECHTARNLFGARSGKNIFMGAQHPNGKGRIPAIAGTTFDWNATDIAEYLRSGFTPDYDVAGGLMAEVIENTSKLSDQDRMAIANYLKMLAN